jgi:hypothetical protein
MDRIGFVPRILRMIPRRFDGVLKKVRNYGEFWGIGTSGFHALGVEHPGCQQPGLWVSVLSWTRDNGPLLYPSGDARKIGIKALRR